MSRNGAIVVSGPKEEQFVSWLLLVKKRDGRSCPVVNLKNLNSNIPFQYFKIEGFFLLKEIFLPGEKCAK